MMEDTETRSVKTPEATPGSVFAALSRYERLLSQASEAVTHLERTIQETLYDGDEVMPDIAREPIDSPRTPLARRLCAYNDDLENTLRRLLVMRQRVVIE